MSILVIVSRETTEETERERDATRLQLDVEFMVGYHSVVISNTDDLLAGNYSYYYI